MLLFNEILKIRKGISELKQKENLYLDCHLISKCETFGLIYSYKYRGKRRLTTIMQIHPLNIAYMSKQFDSHQKVTHKNYKGNIHKVLTQVRGRGSNQNRTFIVLVILFFY